MTTSTSAPPTGRSAGRFIAVVAGSILAALAVTFVALGGALVGMHSTKRDADGFYATGKKTLETPTHALVADKLDANGPGWLFRKSRLGTIRVEATGTAAKPVFVGVARTSQVDALPARRRAGRDDRFRGRPVLRHLRPPAGHRDAGGARATRRSGPSHASGSGRQTLTWPVQKGNWAVVIMNADGTSGIADARQRRREGGLPRLARGRPAGSRRALRRRRGGVLLRRCAGRSRVPRPPSAGAAQLVTP